MTGFFFLSISVVATEINLCQIRLRYQLSVVFCQIRQGLSKLTKTTGFYVTYFPSGWIALIQWRAGLHMHHHPNEPLVMYVQSTCLI